MVAETPDVEYVLVKQFVVLAQLFALEEIVVPNPAIQQAIAFVRAVEPVRPWEEPTPWTTRLLQVALVARPPLKVTDEIPDFEAVKEIPVEQRESMFKATKEFLSYLPKGSAKLAWYEAWKK